MCSGHRYYVFDEGFDAHLDVQLEVEVVRGTVKSS